MSRTEIQKRAAATRTKVIERLARGETGKEIAAALGISRRALRWRIGEIMQANGLSGPGDERRLVARAARGELRP